MSSVTIKDRRDFAIADVDPHNEALVTQDEIHSNIHRGVFFTASSQSVIALSSTLEFLIKVGATRSAHTRFALSVSQDMILELFEAPTTSADGTSIPAVNRNRFSPITAVKEVFSGPTVSADGDFLFEGYIPGGDKHTASGGQGGSFEEWILKTNTNYLLRVTNNIISPAIAGRVGAAIEFYEPNLNKS